MSDCGGNGLSSANRMPVNLGNSFFMYLRVCLFVCFFIQETCCFPMARVYMDTKLLSFFN